VKDIYSALPFDNYIVAVSLTGREVLETLEHGLSGVERGEGRFPQVSGIRVTFRQSLPPGSRTESVLVDGEPLDPDKVYMVATNDFLAAGGDGYKAFGDAIRERGDFTQTGGVLKSGTIRYSDPSRWLRDIIISHVKTSGTLAPVVEGRIKELRESSMHRTPVTSGNNMHNSYR
jgi:2',3'-cyclic-nucleotide 2'-phosphodiesterase (5'-nucleotidase family)